MLGAHRADGNARHGHRSPDHHAEDKPRRYPDRVGRPPETGGLPDLAPEPLREWQGRRIDALRLAERVSAMQDDRERLRQEAREGVATLASALSELGYAVGEVNGSAVHALPSLIDEAMRWERQAVGADAAWSAKNQAAEAQRVEREQVIRSIAETEAAFVASSCGAGEWHVRLCLSPETVPDAFKVRLDELDGLARQAAALSEARQRQAQAQAILDDVVTQANQVAALLGKRLLTLSTTLQIGCGPG